MLISSIFVLSISVVLKNKSSGMLVHLFYKKHNELLFFSEGISLVKGILAGEGNLIKKEEAESQEKNKSEGKKDTTVEDALAYFLSLYWLHGNKWLHFDVNDNIRNETRAIDIYLQFDDGKYPLIPFFNEFSSLKKNVSQQEKKENEAEKKSQGAQDKSGEDLEMGKKIEEEIEKSTFLKEYKKCIEAISKKYSFAKKINQDLAVAKEDDKIVWRVFLKDIKDKNIFSFLQFKNMPQSFLFQTTFNEEEDSVKEKKPDKNYCFSDVFSMDISAASVFYLSPAILHLLKPEEFSFSAEERSSILKSCKEMIKKKSKDTKLKDMWTNIFGKTVKVDYPDKSYNPEYLEKIFSTECDFPEVVTAYIIEYSYQTKKQIRVVLRRNKKYTKKNENACSDFVEYLLESVYVL